MARVKIDWILAVSLAGLGVLPVQPGMASTGEGEQRLAEAAAGLSGQFGDRADLMLRYIQEDGPESGHVRILLAPETRPLTQAEARSAAQQAFLKALKEPGLGDNLSRITVVVRLMPASLPDLETAEQIIVFLHKGGQDWAVLSGE